MSISLATSLSRPDHPLQKIKTALEREFRELQAELTKAGKAGDFVERYLADNYNEVKKSDVLLYAFKKCELQFGSVKGKEGAVLKGASQDFNRDLPVVGFSKSTYRSLCTFSKKVDGSTPGVMSRTATVTVDCRPWLFYFINLTSDNLKRVVLKSDTIHTPGQPSSNKLSLRDMVEAKKQEIRKAAGPNL